MPSLASMPFSHNINHMSNQDFFSFITNTSANHAKERVGTAKRGPEDLKKEEKAPVEQTPEEKAPEEFTEVRATKVCCTYISPGIIPARGGTPVRT